MHHLPLRRPSRLANPQHKVLLLVERRLQRPHKRARLQQLRQLAVARPHLSQRHLLPVRVYPTLGAPALPRLSVSRLHQASLSLARRVEVQAKVSVLRWLPPPQCHSRRAPPSTLRFHRHRLHLLRSRQRRLRAFLQLSIPRCLPRGHHLNLRRVNLLRARPRPNLSASRKWLRECRPLHRLQLCPYLLLLRKTGTQSSTQFFFHHLA